MITNTTKIKYIYIMLDQQKFKISGIDTRDKKYIKSSDPVRDTVDLREWDSLVEDQSYVGSCTGQAVSSAYELMVKHLYPTSFTELSEMFIYYNARLLAGEENYDSGASIRNALKGLKMYGVCRDDLCPYNPGKVTVKPSDECYKDAKQRIIPLYQSLDTVEDMLSAINNNYPVVIGMQIFESFMYLDSVNYTITVPENDKDRGYDGGAHAVCVVGYDKPKELFLVKNSYGNNWGLNGYCYITFDYITQYAFEKWIFDIPSPTVI